MSEAELRLLKESVDQIVAIDTGGQTVPAQVLFVFDEGPTPDVFYREMQQAEDGTLTHAGKNRQSTLLSEITAVRPFPHR